MKKRQSDRVKVKDREAKKDEERQKKGGERN